MSTPLTTLIAESLPARRKRGRPRKDGDVTRTCILQSTTTPTQESMKKFEKYEVNLKDDGVIKMLGQNVFGVIEGSFDAGYLITVRIGNNDTLLRGVVFLPGKITPITDANDVAPQAKMYQRTEIPISEMEYQNQVNDIDITPLPIMPRTSSSSSLGKKISIAENQEVRLEEKSQSTPPIENLRMVEQDEVMQVFEVSTPSKDRIMADTETVKVVSQSSFTARNSNFPGTETMNQEPPIEKRCSIYELNGTPIVVAQLHSVPGELQAMESKLQPTDPFHNESKSSNFKLYQDLFADKSYPAVFHEQICSESKFQQGARDVKTPLKLELGESTMGGRLELDLASSSDCTNNMDFVLTDVVQPMEPRYHHSSKHATSMNLSIDEKNINEFNLEQTNKDF